ncbi:prepilin peptidase [Microbacterium paludicola]|uniref:prepilin peptidase n=1 Tax=Microbacterium paludicola TaxID=300019 RepID=UPI0014313EB9|nr:A24 family peptidase [Microbacterium paludicola]MBF0816279.1 prepilin peptidase [Microbacterium paludicola]
MTTIASTPTRIQAAGFGILLAAAAVALGVLAGHLTLNGAEQAIGWAATAVFAPLGLGLAVIDAREHRLPNLITLPLAAAMAIVVTAGAGVSGQWAALVQALLSGLGLGVVLMLVAMTGTLAFGDVKLGLSLGILTGWFSWTLPLTAVFAAYVLAMPHALALLARKRRTEAPAAAGPTFMPMGPYLVAGALLVTLATLLL